MPPIRRENRAYKKSSPFRDHRKFILICEGEREADYFEYFKNKYQKLVVEVLAPAGKFHGHSSPSRLKERASHFIKEEEWDDSLDDEMWFIADTDRWGAQLHELSDLCNTSKNWFLAISNPCFEVWLFYHYDCGQVTESEAGEMKRLLNKQKPGGYQRDIYIKRIEKAIECSGSLDKHADQNIPEMGITKVYKLGEKIMELLPKKDGFADL